MSDPARLSERSHWDQVHRSGADRDDRARRLARALLGDEGFTYLQRGGYAAHVVHERLLGPHLPRGARVLEVGSAPGLALAKLATRFGAEPWGLDYSEDGVRANRATFERFGFDPAHVLHGDFFDDGFLDAHRGAFDVVTSNGFIEHFDDVRAVVARHVALVRPGGLVAISVPNLTGVNGLLTRFFHRALLDAHNLDIMALDAFARLFDGFGLTSLACERVGLFHLGLQATPPGSPKRHLLRAGLALQIPLELVERRLFGTHAPAPAWSSPYLYYVGRLDGAA